jgi:tetratricopeptide (TPR) repeat protein
VKKHLVPRKTKALRFAVQLLLLCAVPCAHAFTIEPDRQWDFALKLFHAGQYRRAAEEYQRFAFFFPQDGRRREATLNAGIAFLKAGDPATALAQLSTLTVGPLLDAAAKEAYFLSADSLLQMNAPTQAILQLHNLIALSDEIGLRDRAHYRLTWIHIGQHDWSAAQRELGRIENRIAYPVDRLLSALRTSGEIPSKNPIFAGALSILPGAGQLYSERYQDALIAFIVNVGLAWAAVESFQHEQYALGGIITGVSFGFYLGNIYGAVTGAHKYNQAQRERFADEMRRESFVPPMAYLHAETNGKSWSLSLNINF